MIYYIPIEPLEERYTKQWYEWFVKEFSVNYKVLRIEGETLTDKIKTGHFLDVNSTLAYKSSQLNKIAKLFYDKKIKKDDIFFIADLEFWGIESIRYLSVLNNTPVKIYAFLHAASYTPEDFMQSCMSFAKFFEKGWLEICDKIFVGSKFHKELICKERGQEYKNKIVITGNPWNTKEVLRLVNKKIKKRNQIIYSDLPDYRKRPNIFMNLVPVIKQLYPEIEIVFTTSREKWGEKDRWLRQSAKALERLNLIKIKENLSKEEYYRILAESKVMVSTNTITESFGYCACEALTFDTNPILPNMFSYPELCRNDERLLYNNYNEIIPKVIKSMKNPIKTKKYAEYYNNSIKRMIKEF